MTIRRVLALQPGYANLSKNAKGAVNTLAIYGGGNGLLLGGTRLNNAINGADIDLSSTIATLTGAKPAIGKWMLVDPFHEFYAGQNITAQVTADYEAGIAAMRAHWDAGGIVAMSLMAPNFVTGGDWSDRERSDITPVSHLKLGSPNAAALKAWQDTIDRLAVTLKTRLVDRFGVPIPVFWVWFGECNGWYDYRLGEGLYPTTQVEGRTILAMKRVTGQSYYEFTFVARAGYNVPDIPGPGTAFQVEGAANPAWNGCYFTNQWLAGPAGDAPGTGQTVTITAWRGGGRTNNNGVADVSAGTTVAYQPSGSWAAGIDRADDLMIVIQEAIARLRAQGVDSLISSMAPFPEQYWSTNQNNRTAGGVPLEYRRWNPGQDVLDGSAVNIYRPNSSPTLNVPSLRDSVAAHRALHGFKPMLINELGFSQESEAGPTAAFRADPNFWPREWDLIAKNYPFVSGATIWSKAFIPSVGDPAFQGFVNMVRGGSCITLERLNRLT